MYTVLITITVSGGFLGRKVAEKYSKRMFLNTHQSHHYSNLNY